MVSQGMARIEGNPGLERENAGSGLEKSRIRPIFIV
jgi:hypothetical protein